MAEGSRIERAKIPPSILGIGILVWRFISWWANVDFLFSLTRGSASDTLQFLSRQGWWITFIASAIWFFFAGKAMKPKRRTIQVEIIFACSVISFLFGILIAVKNAEPAVQVFSEWGTNPAGCTGVSTVERLKNFAPKYEMAMVCVIGDPSVDVFKNLNIAKTGLFEIQNTRMFAPYSGETAVRAAMPNPEGIAHYLVLVPKGTPMAEITCLEDVKKKSGMVMFNQSS